MALFARPVLCRLCGFPAPDGGVPVSEVDRGKLSEWCLRMMDTELDQEGLDKAVVCQFCLWQAKFLEENYKPSEENRLPIWWKNQRDTFRNKDCSYIYFLDELIQPCTVTIPEMSKENLQKHGLLLNNGTNWTQRRKRSVISNCIYCPAQLKNKTAVLNHVLEEHKNDLTYRCFRCNIFFLSRQEKDVHLQELHPCSKVKCPLCFVQLASKYILAKHMTLEHNNTKTWRCKYRCSAFFVTETQMRDHVQQKHEGGGKVKCIYCKKYFWQSALTAHVRKRHGSIFIKCNFVANCPSFFHNKDERDKHILEAHETGFDRVQCIYCQKRIPRKLMSTHMKKDHKEVAVMCPYYLCTTYFHTEEEKKKHVIDVHESRSDVFKCIYCRLVFKNTRGNVNHHMHTHHKTEAIRCDYLVNCPTYFLTQEEKQKHIEEVHGGGRDKIKCKFCPSMVRIQGMRGHIRRHHRSESKGVEEEMVDCIYCNKSQKQVSLYFHMTDNHKTEAIKCNFHKFCSTYFLTVEDRQKHIAEVHMVGKEVRLTCQFCKIVLGCSTLLRKHIGKRHPEAIKCQIRSCLEYFSSKEEREEHLKLIHVPEDKKKTFRCYHCSFAAITRQERDDHSAQFHKEANVQCPKCPKLWKSKNALKSHLSFSHGTTRKCPHCLAHVKRISWSFHIQRTSCPTCKAVFHCRAVRSKHPRKCIRQYFRRE